MKIIKILVLPLCLCLTAFAIHRQSSTAKLSQSQVSDIKEYKSWTPVTPTAQLIIDPSTFG
jgi:hypothetical protein